MASSADQAKLDADAAFKAGEFSKAVELYTTAIAENAKNGTNPKHVLLSNRSACHAKLQQWDKALEDAKNCIVANSSFAKGFSRKGAALHGKGDYVGAAQAYQRALDLEANNETFKQGLAAAKQAAGGTQSSSNASASSSSSSSRPGAAYSSNSGAASSSSASGKRPSLFLDVVILLAQIFAVVCAVMYLLTSDPHQSRFLFMRATLAATVSYFLTAVARHGMPDMGTFKVMWKAFRGQATQADTRGIFNFAQDDNTHYLFYCPILISCTPSLVLLMPVILSSAVTASQRGKRLADMSAVTKKLSEMTFDKVVAREAQLKQMCGNAEVLILIFMVVELFTPRRNLLFLILYLQLIKVRMLINPDSKAAWTNAAQKCDSVFLHARSPAPVQTVYRKVRGFVAGQMNPQMPPR